MAHRVERGTLVYQVGISDMASSSPMFCYLDYTAAKKGKHQHGNVSWSYVKRPKRMPAGK